MSLPAPDTVLDSAPASAAAEARAASGATLSVRVFETLEAAEAIWRELETRAVLTPYQRFDWIAAWHRAGGTSGRLALVVIDVEGRAAALLPLEIGRRLGLRRATIIGSDMGNSDWLILDPAYAGHFRPEPLLAAIGEAARQADGIDLVSLFDQPAEWNGIANPLLAFPHQPSPDHFHFGTVNAAGSFDLFDAKRLANLNRRKRKLADLLGPVELRAATTPGEIDRAHAAFLEQRAARFAQMGVHNIFGEPHFVRFMRDGAVASLGEARPTLIFHALYAGDTIVATSCGTFGGTHFSQYINATAGGEAAKFRLIGILMHELFLDCAARGAKTIDMGLGDFDYKGDWTVPVAAFDGMIPLTAIGHLGGRALLAGRRLKRAIKQHDKLWTLAKSLRARLAGAKPPAS